MRASTLLVCDEANQALCSLHFLLMSSPIHTISHGRGVKLFDVVYFFEEVFAPFSDHLQHVLGRVRRGATKGKYMGICGDIVIRNRVHAFAPSSSSWRAQGRRPSPQPPPPARYLVHMPRCTCRKVPPSHVRAFSHLCSHAQITTHT